ncbi:hypothetical protein RHMOL_Rhmol07G0285400 [Rhododendron molle]|uniref:Uncharacterized protein n=1 Tax=Rhododendron molle TaxID=49168 RepID=A0ACC0N791_RHOML|nr:hypothetical protein RHMOL_Rhmol07G0285400 [Rhododendron molle]
MDLKQHGSGPENQLLQIDNQLLDDRRQWQAEQNTLHFSRPPSIHNSEKNPELPKINQNAVATEQKPGNPRGQVPFGLLLPLLTPQLDKDRSMQLQTVFDKLKKYEISRDIFVHNMRSIVGAQMLKIAVYKLHAQGKQARNLQTGPNQLSLQSQASAQEQHQKMQIVGPHQGNVLRPPVPHAIPRSRPRGGSPQRKRVCKAGEFVHGQKGEVSEDDGDGDDEDEDDDDYKPLFARLPFLRAQDTAVAAAAPPPEIIEINSPVRETQRVEEVVPPQGPAPYPLPPSEISRVEGGMFWPPIAFEDLFEDPNTVSSSSSSSSEDNYYYIPAGSSLDPAPSPSHAATSEARQSPPTPDTHKSAGNHDVDTRSQTQLRDDEEEDIFGLSILEREDPYEEEHQAEPVAASPSREPSTGAGQTGMGEEDSTGRVNQVESTSAPPDPLQDPQLSSAKAPSSESFLLRVAAGLLACSNASVLWNFVHPLENNLATDATSPLTPGFSTSGPFASRTPVPLTGRPGNIPSGQFRLSGDLSTGPTSLTSSQLEYLVKDVDIVPGDDVLGGQGSATFGDYGPQPSGDLGNQGREEESGEEMHFRSSSAVGSGKGNNTDLAGRGKDQVVEEEQRAASPAGEVIRLFPGGFAVDEAYFPLLNSIATAFPETFANFRPRSSHSGALFLVMLHDMVRAWIQLPINELTPDTEASLRGDALDVQDVGLDISWLVRRVEEVKLSAEKAAVDQPLREAEDQLEAARQRVAELEVVAATARQRSSELAATVPNLAGSPPALSFAFLLPP